MSSPKTFLSYLREVRGKLFFPFFFFNIMYLPPSQYLKLQRMRVKDIRDYVCHRKEFPACIVQVRLTRHLNDIKNPTLSYTVTWGTAKRYTDGAGWSAIEFDHSDRNCTEKLEFLNYHPLYRDAQELSQFSDHFWFLVQVI